MKKSYSVKEVDRELGHSTNGVYGFLKEGLIKPIRIVKGIFRVPRTEAEKYRAKGVVREEEFDKPVEIGPGDRKDRTKVPAKTIMTSSILLSTPRPGKSLADLSGEKPLYFLKLWFEERVGLPRLFDWFVGLSSVILGISMYLYTKQLDLLRVGRFSGWLDPIRISLILGGFGLILADMIQDEYSRYRNFSNYFRVILTATYAGLSLILLLGKDLDGFTIYGLFAMAILVEAVLKVRSSTAYMLYIQGLLLSTAIYLYLFPENIGLSGITSILFVLLGAYQWIWLVVVASFVMVLLYGFLWDKKVLKVSSLICGVLLMVLAVYYAGSNYWSKSFFVFIAGTIGVLLPFWEKMRVSVMSDRPLIFRMFGTVLMTFSLVVLLIGVVQSILITNGKQNLLEKAEYGRISSERTVDNVLSTLDGVVTNPSFVSAVVQKDVVMVDGFARAIFRNNKDLGVVITIDKFGKPISSYPFSVEVMRANYSGESFFIRTMGGGKYFSRTAEDLPAVSGSVITIATPILNAEQSVTGVLVAPINVSTFGDRLSEISAGEQMVSIIDENGRWVINPDEKLVGTKVSDADTVSLLWQTDTGVEIGHDTFGRFSLLSSNRSDDLGWSVLVSQPIFSVLDVSRTGLVLVLILLMIITLVISFTFVRSSYKNEPR